MTRYYSRRFVRRLALPLVVLGLAGCSAQDRADTLAGFNEINTPGALGKLIDHPAPPVPVTQGGPSGVLIGGPVAAQVPETAIDRVVAEPLREWLTVEERRNLAAASETAAAFADRLTIAWQAKDGGNAHTAAGSATPIADVFRSKRGAICRDISQHVEKNAAHHAQTITLCREAQENGAALWLIGAAD